MRPPDSIQVETVENGYVVRADWNRPKVEGNNYPGYDSRRYVAYNGADLDATIARLKGGTEEESNDAPK